MLFGNWRAKTAAGVAVLGACMAWTAVPASAATGPPGTTPAFNTPQLASTGTTEQVRQLAQCGNTMYAVGTFTAITQGGTTFPRNNVFSFSASKPYTMTSWNPNVNGIVNGIAFSPDCSTAYLGGKFSTIGGVAVKNIAAVSTSTGAVITGFGHNASGQVETLQYYNGHILTGGYYTSINNSSANPYMTSLNPTTGKDDGFIHLSISGNYQFPGVSDNPTRVYNQQLSHSGTLDMVEGDFTSVGGQARQQMFMLNLSGPTATVTGWTSPELNTDCNYNESFYAQAAAWSSRRLHHLRRDDRLQAERLTGRGDPADRAVRRGHRLPDDADQRQPHLDQLHGLRLAVLGGSRLQHRVLRRPRALVGKPQRLRRARARGPSPRPAWRACPSRPAR